MLRCLVHFIFINLEHLAEDVFLGLRLLHLRSLLANGILADCIVQELLLRFLRVPQIEVPAPGVCLIPEVDWVLALPDEFVARKGDIFFVEEWEDGPK